MSIRYDKFTLKTQEGLQACSQVAGLFGNQQLEPVHLLLALLGQEEGVVPAILARLGVSADTLRQEAETTTEALPKVSGGSEDYLSPALKGVLEAAVRETESFKDEFVSTEHFFLALTKDKSGKVGEILKRHGISHDAVLKALTAVRGPHRVTDLNPEAKYQALERYARDLTDLARCGKLDPVIGRDDEVRRVIQVLSRRTKNNPVGWGKGGQPMAAWRRES